MSIAFGIVVLGGAIALAAFGHARHRAARAVAAFDGDGLGIGRQTNADALRAAAGTGQRRRSPLAANDARGWHGALACDEDTTRLT